MFSNKKIGNNTEKEFADFMFERGWWVHIFADKINGQPCDVVMIKGNMTYLVDVKHVADNKYYFLHSRVEENQKNVFKMLKARGFNNTGFVIKFEDGWYFLPFDKIDFSETRTLKRDMNKIG